MVGQLHYVGCSEVVTGLVFLVEAVMKRLRIGNTLAVALAAGAIVLTAADIARAEGQGKEIAGQYQCTQAKVAGKTVPCKAAPLLLKADGHFEVQGREGEYLVSGTWVELNGEVLKSRAKIEAGHKIVFRFYNKKGLCEMIFERRVAELGKTKLG